MVLCLTYIDNGITLYGQWTRPIDHVLCARAIFRLADMSGGGHVKLVIRLVGVSGS
jgi:hypothetical protein